MKKTLSFVLLSLLGASVMAFGGCGNHSGDDTARTKSAASETEITETAPEDCDDCPESRPPRVILRRKNGVAVGFYTEFDGGEFFIFRFGGRDGGLPELPEGEN